MSAHPPSTSTSPETDPTPPDSVHGFVELPRNTPVHIYLPADRCTLLPTTKKGKLNVPKRSWPRTSKEWDAGVGISVESSENSPTAEAVRNVYGSHFNVRTKHLPSDPTSTTIIFRLKVCTITEIPDDLRLLLVPTENSSTHAQISPSSAGDAKWATLARFASCSLAHQWSFVEVKASGCIYSLSDSYTLGLQDGLGRMMLGNMDKTKEQQSEQ